MTQNIFEEIKHINEFWNEYWKAREFAKVLWYKDFSNFLEVIKKAKISCKNSKNDEKNHFSKFTEMVKIGSWAERWFDSYKLSRYACYLIIQNADPKKEMVALWQTYFAIQTRKQEVNEQLIEDSRRVQLREEMKKHNKSLAQTADKAGVKFYWKFTNYWYKGLYDWLDAKWIHTKKWLKKSQQILDHMWSEELAANLFRATQAEAKLKRENIFWEEKANIAHFEVWKEVRETIKKLWGTMPEELPAKDNIKKAEKRLENQKKLK
jgi:DNA-damage-inducible protein D